MLRAIQSLDKETMKRLKSLMYVANIALAVVGLGVKRPSFGYRFSAFRKIRAHE